MIAADQLPDDHGAVDLAAVETIVEEAILRYFAARRAKVPGFVDRHFSARGSLVLHRRALGLDIVRAPVNVAMVIPKVITLLVALGLRRIGATTPAERLSDLQLFLDTDVGRELVWLVNTELLELPFADNGRQSTQDALAIEIVADPRLGEVLGGVLDEARERLGAEEVSRRLGQALETYTGARAATADITNALLMVGTGALALKQMTPGAISMGPAVAGVLAQQTAVASFPLGATLGGAWYGFFPASPSAALVVGSTTGIMLVASCVAAFSGILTDPVQRRLGIHQRRLWRFLDSTEALFLGRGNRRFEVRDHYVARLLDLYDTVRAVLF
jgi:hypothetical protein